MSPSVYVDGTATTLIERGIDLLQSKALRGETAPGRLRAVPDYLPDGEEVTTVKQAAVLMSCDTSVAAHTILQSVDASDELKDSALAFLEQKVEDTRNRNNSTANNDFNSKHPRGGTGTAAGGRFVKKNTTSQKRPDDKKKPQKPKAPNGPLKQGPPEHPLYDIAEQGAKNGDGAALKIGGHTYKIKVVNGKVTAVGPKGHVFEVERGKDLFHSVAQTVHNYQKKFRNEDGTLKKRPRDYQSRTVCKKSDEEGDIESKGVRHVRDSAYWGQPVGTIIIGRSGKSGSVLKNLKAMKNEWDDGYAVQNSKGKKFIVADGGDGKHYALDYDTGDWNKVFAEGSSLEDALKALDAKQTASSRAKKASAGSPAKSRAADDKKPGEYDRFTSGTSSTTVVKTDKGEWITRSHTGRMSARGTLYHHTKKFDSYEAALASAKRQHGVTDETVKIGDRDLKVGDPVDTEYGRGKIASIGRGIGIELDNGEKINVVKGTPGHGRLKPAKHSDEALNSARAKAKYAGIDYGHGSPKHMEAQAEYERMVSENAAKGDKKTLGYTDAEWAKIAGAKAKFLSDGDANALLQKRGDQRVYGLVGSQIVKMNTAADIKKHKPLRLWQSPVKAGDVAGSSRAARADAKITEALDAYSDSQVRDTIRSLRSQIAALKRVKRSVPNHIQKMLDEYLAEASKRGF